MSRRVRKKRVTSINLNDIRDYSLYALKLSNNKYYVGLTSYKNPERRIKQHGGRMGAFVNLGLKVTEVIEIRKLGKMTRLVAERLENDMTNEYMDKYGQQNVKGGRMIRRGRVFLREYNLRSNQWVTQTFWLTLTIFLIVVTCLLIIIQQ